MIEIGPPSSRKNDKTKVKDKKGASPVKSGGKPFSAELQNSIIYNFEGTIDELMDDLKDQEKRFIDSESLQEMSRYKALVQKILKTILDEGFTVKTMKSSRKHGLEMRIVQDINSRLMEIKNAVTNSNKAFNLMKSIEEIRGLILDLIY